MPITTKQTAFASALFANLRELINQTARGTLHLPLALPGLSKARHLAFRYDFYAKRIVVKYNKSSSMLMVITPTQILPQAVTRLPQDERDALREYIRELGHKSPTELKRYLPTAGKILELCCICGAGLTDPISARAGIGPVCAEKIFGTTRQEAFAELFGEEWTEENETADEELDF